MFESCRWRKMYLNNVGSADVKVPRHNEEKRRGGDEWRGCQISIHTLLYWQGHLNSALPPPPRINCWDSKESMLHSCVFPKALRAARTRERQEEMGAKLSSRLPIAHVKDRSVSGKEHFTVDVELKRTIYQTLKVSQTSLKNFSLVFLTN